VIKRSPPIVSAIQEYSRSRPETFGDFHLAFGEWEPGDVTEYANSPDFRPILASLGSLAERRNAWLGGGRIRTSIWRIRNRMLLPAREDLQNPISSEFISSSKHSNFENRTESAESRALERIGPFGEEWSGFAG
jgi:hypothetical protein